MDVRKVIFGGACSLDGHFAGPNDESDWMMWGPEAAKASAESMKGADAMLWGRRTYEIAVRAGMGGYPGLINYVFSRTLEGPLPGVELVRGEAAGFVRELKARPGGDIMVMGGAILGHALIEAGLVDEIGLAVHPILLGGGVPAFHPMTGRKPLELIGASPFSNGCVLLRYRVRETRDARWAAVEPQGRP